MTNATPYREVNMDLVNQVLKVIREHPDHWDQDTFFNSYAVLDDKDIAPSSKVDELPCGTTMCFAGWTLHLNGKTEWKNSFGEWRLFYPGPTEQAAAELLGFNPYLAHMIFYKPWSDNINDFEQAVRADIEEYGKMTRADLLNYLDEEELDELSD